MILLFQLTAAGQAASDFGIRISFGFRISDFGFHVGLVS